MVNSIGPGQTSDVGRWTEAKSGEVEGGERRADTGRTTKGNGGRRTEISFYFVLVIPPFCSTSETKNL